jgi:hypothetical protein
MCLVAVAMLAADMAPIALAQVVRLSSEPARQAMRQDSSFAK